MNSELKARTSRHRTFAQGAMILALLSLYGMIQYGGWKSIVFAALVVVASDVTINQTVKASIFGASAVIEQVEAKR